jgi:RHS repeat-associated protein
VLAKAETASRDLNGDDTGKTVQHFRYDSFNNATQTCVEYGDGSRTLTENTYDSSPDIVRPDLLFLGRLTQAKVSHFRTSTPITCDQVIDGVANAPASEVLTNVATFAYDIRRDASGALDKNSTGVLVREKANSDHPLSVTKTYERDTYGNLIRETATTADFPPRTKTTEFDTHGRFPIAELNALGHAVRYQYSDLLGVATKVTDPNGVSTENSYDGFQRLIAAISPSGLRSTDSRMFVGDGSVFNRDIVFKQVQKVGDLPEVTTYFDFQGRVLRTEKLGPSSQGPRKIFQDTDYDARGRVVRSSLPYFEGDPQNFSSSSFDSLDRPVMITAPDGGITRSAYTGLVTTLTDANGKVSVKRVNEKGLTVETLDNAGGKLTFIYGPGDRLLKTVQVDGLELTNGYDQVGNKVLSVDPDLGKWEYRYNGFGEIVWQRDAKGQITSVSYDVTGRPLRRHMPDKLDQFTYDQAAFGIGKPSTVSSSDGYEEQFTYDNKGRLDRKSTRVNGELFTTSVQYDAYDRVTQAYHPGNYVVTNEYDEFGFLARVRANDPLSPFELNHKVYWEAGERDQYGRLRSETLGNGVESDYDFDELKGNLKSFGSQFDSEQIVSVALDYDLVGNLKWKEDKVGSHKEVFQYDNLDRLTDWSINGKSKGSYAYDAAGRMLSKTDMGQYDYSGVGPAHAVKRIVGKDGKESEYRYDANGNMVFGPKGHFEYYANNAVRLIYKSKDAWSRFAYAPDGSRYFQHFSETREVGKGKFVSNVLLTVTVGAYEQIRDSGGTFIVKPGGYERHRLYLSAENGVVAVLEHSTEFDPLFRDLKVKAANAGTPLSIAQTLVSAHYLHKDQLGSVIKVTNDDGYVVSGYSYDPWGKKTQTAWADKGKQDFAENTFRRGFTGHEHLDNLDLIHMNGRVYDPSIARFVSADIQIQLPKYSAGYDRYQYVLNNPVRYVDATGYSLLGDFFGGLWDVFTAPFKEAWNFLKKNWKTIVVITVSVVVSAATGGVGGFILAGAISGGLNAYLYGGDILEGAIRGGLFAALSAGFGDALGGAVSAQYGSVAGQIAGSVGAGVVGGVQAEMSGGSFWTGFATAAISKAAQGHIRNIRTDIVRNAAHAVVGGTVSVIGGGKFGNGAVFAAYGAILGNAFDQGAKVGRSIGASLVAAGRDIVDTFTKVASWMNTSIGLLYGSLGWALGGDRPYWDENYNGLVFGNSPLMAGGGGLTLGNTIHVGSDITSMRSQDANAYAEFMNHERVHTYQSQALGPFYLPAWVSGATLSFPTSYIGMGSNPTRFHGRLNMLETNPFNGELYGH